MKTCPVCDTHYPDQHNTCPTDGSVLIESHELEPGYFVRGKYRIVRTLGHGGMGIVYLAEHLLLGGELALKFLNPELSKSPQFVKRFRNEARVAYQLRHPNIVEVVDLDQDEKGQLFIAMEYVSGLSLRTVLKESKAAMSVVRVLQIARGVASGLAAAHARGTVHRDIKPENILIRMEASGEVQPKILDFGIAAMTESITNLSRTHGLLLTPEYAAPEQWRGTPATELDGRTDLYALGGVMYEMLVGRTPFRAANPEGWLYQHLQCSPEPLSALRPNLDSEYPGLGAIVMRLLAKDRDQRFASASVLLNALTSLSAEIADPFEIKESNPINLSSTSSTKVDSPRMRGLIGAGVALVAVVVSVSLWIGLGHEHAGMQPETVKPEVAVSTPIPQEPRVPEAAQTQIVAKPNLQEEPARNSPDSKKSASHLAAGTKASSPDGLAAESHEEARKIVFVSPDAAERLLLKKTAPVYPPIALAARVTGTVVLDAIISKTGTIDELHVVSGPGMLRKAAIEGVKTWRYQPYKVNGKLAEVETTINVVFALN
jgi:eukaryotic-like serine/threonine-protein kinase